LITEENDIMYCTPQECNGFVPNKKAMDIGAADNGVLWITSTEPKDGGFLNYKLENG
jgi:hypothetical protein